MINGLPVLEISLYSERSVVEYILGLDRISNEELKSFPESVKVSFEKRVVGLNEH